MPRLLSRYAMLAVDSAIMSLPTSWKDSIIGNKAVFGVTASVSATKMFTSTVFDEIARTFPHSGY